MADWNEASDEIKMGVGPQSRAWAIRHLIGNFPNRNGIPDRSIEAATLIVDALLEQPYPWSVGWATEEKMNAAQVVEYARSNCFLLTEWGKTGWIDREGKVYTCTYATHEKLLYNVLKITGEEAESQGWVRSDHMRWRAAFKISAEQKKVLRKMGHVVDNKAQKDKPDWVESAGLHPK